MVTKKKNKKKVQASAKMSTVRYMREKVRNLPIGKCYVNSQWNEIGMARVLVSRLRPDGRIAAALFLVDTYCLGVKGAVFYVDMDSDAFQHLVSRDSSIDPMQEISYNEAHNLIYGAVSFAEEGGIHPCKDYNTARYILEEDTDDVPLIEYEYGKDGKHFLMMNDQQDKIHLHTLQKNLGDDFEFVDYTHSEEDYDEEDDWDEEADKKIPREPYSYSHPAYPQTLEIQHTYLADVLYAQKPSYDLPDVVVQRILDLPADEVVQDLSHIIFYEIGRTYQAINEGTIQADHQYVLLHAMLLLTKLERGEGLEALLEILRQNKAFIDYHLADWLMDFMYKAIYACGKDRLPVLINFIYQPGILSILRNEVVIAMVMIVYQHPERRSEIIEELRKLLLFMETHLPELHACDGEFAGLVIQYLVDMKAVELIPEIKRVFATGCVHTGICGDSHQVLRELSTQSGWRWAGMFEVEDIFETYDTLR